MVKPKAKGVNPDRKSGAGPLRWLGDELHHHSGSSCSPVVVKTLCPASLLAIAAGPRGGGRRGVQATHGLHTLLHPGFSDSFYGVTDIFVARDGHP